MNPAPPSMQRLPTTVRGLDTILSGGPFAAGVSILKGPPGEAAG